MRSPCSSATETRRSRTSSSRSAGSPQPGQTASLDAVTESCQGTRSATAATRTIQTFRSPRAARATTTTPPMPAVPRTASGAPTAATASSVTARNATTAATLTPMAHPQDAPLAASWRHAAGTASCNLPILRNATMVPKTWPVPIRMQLTGAACRTASAAPSAATPLSMARRHVTTASTTAPTEPARPIARRLQSAATARLTRTTGKNANPLCQMTPIARTRAVYQVGAATASSSRPKYATTGRSTTTATTVAAPRAASPPLTAATAS